MITADLPRDGPVTLQTPTRVLDRRLNGPAQILPSAAQSVAAVRTPGVPLSVLECSGDYFDGDVFYSKHLPGCGDSMMPVNQIIIVVDVADHTDRRKFFAASQGAQVVLYHIGL